MREKRPLSDKKISRQTISISPALRDDIIRFINKKHKKSPEDSRYKSVSAFFTYIMEKTLEILKQGKTLDDLSKIADKSIRDFFNQNTYKALIFNSETNLSMSKYLIPKFSENPSLFLKAKEFFSEKKDESQIDLMELVTQFRNYLISNKVTRTFDLEVKGGNNFYVEHTGNYKNLHFNAVKLILAVFGFFGLEVNNVIYSEKEMYAKFNFKKTPIFNKSNLLLRKRKKIADKNIKQLINYSRIVNDDSCHLWMKMASDNNIVLKFKNEQAIVEWFSKIRNDIERFSASKKLKAKGILNYFEKIHWITFINQQDLVFEFSIYDEGWKEEREFLLEQLSEYGEIVNIGKKYQLKI